MVLLLYLCFQAKKTHILKHDLQIPQNHKGPSEMLNVLAGLILSALAVGTYTSPCGSGL